MFFLNRLIVEFLSPLSCGILLLLLSLLCHILQRGQLGVFFQILGLLVLLGFGYGLGTRGQLAELENRYQPVDLSTVSPARFRAIRYVVVLGSGHVSDPRLPPNSQIGGSSLYRLVEGIRLLGKVAGASLVISGGQGYDPVPNADLVASVARILGVTAGKIIIEKRPRDTIEEAELLQPLLQEQPFLLVSSAAHMARAMAIFSQRGMDPIAAPTDYIIKEHLNPPAAAYFPSSGNLALSKRIIYEWIGTVWSKIKKITANSP